jgi:predicted phage tail protein
MACIPVLTAYFSDPVIVGAALSAAGLKPAIVSAVSIALVAVAKMLSNYSKNS